MKKTRTFRFAVFLFITVFNINIVSAQMVGPDAYIKATSVEIGLDGQGGFEGCSTTTSPPLAGMHFRSGNPLFGFVANPQINLWTTFDGDFFTPGSPENGWGIETGAIIAGNNAVGDFEIPGTITDWTHNFNCYSADWEGDLVTGTNLHVKVNYFLQETDLFYTTTVSITNNTAAVIPELFYYRNLDPDNNVSISMDYTTQNTIVSQPGTGCNLAHVKATSVLPGSQPLSYVGLAAVGANWRAMYGGFSNRDGSDIWNGTGAGFVQTIGATNFADEAIAIAYKIENLAPGATEVMKFVVILDDGSAAQAINNLLYLSYPGSTIGTPQVCTPYVDTIPTCGGPVPIAVTGTNLTDYSWSWSPSTGLSASTGTSVIANPGTTTTYVVSGTPISACVTPISFTFVVHVTSTGSNPVINAVPPICVGSPSFNLTVDSTGGTWSGTGITSASLGTFDPGIAGVGTYMITYATTGLCNTTDTVMITVTPGPDATIIQPTNICINDLPFNLSAATAGGTYTGTGITSGSSGTFDPATAGSGPHIITYTLSGACTAVDTVTINVIAPSPVFTSDITSGCVPTCVNFSETVSTICASVVYLFGDGDTSFVSAPNHCFTAAGIYSVSLQCTDANGCIGTISVPNMITIYPIPVASFTMSPSSPIIFNTTVGFNDNSTGGTTSTWQFDDPSSGANNTSTITSPTHTFETEGDYCITLISTNAGGCVDTAKQCIVVVGEGSIFIPNIFTPNGDLTNDIFVVSSINMKEIYYEIYDRWGLKMAEYNGLTGGWNGETKNGKIAPDGTYYYILNATSLDNKTVKKEGYLQLLSK